MKYIFACGNEWQWKLCIDYGINNLLFSFAYQTNLLRSFKERPPHGKFLFLDSGAFSAWNNGQVIEKQEYLEFAKELMTDYPDNEWHVINLDVIPGSPGTPPNDEDRQASAEQGWENYQWFKDHGLDVLHIFHQHEDLKWLDKLVESSTYIGISPDNSQSVKSRTNWLKYVFQRLQPALPKLRTHGFGATAVSFLKAAPFYSADSSSWTAPARYGVLAEVSLAHGSSASRVDENSQSRLMKLGIKMRNNRFPSTDSLARFFPHYLRLEREITNLWTARGLTY